MHEINEYPGFPRHHVWFVDESVAASTSIFSPVFEIDRGMGVSSTNAAPTGATAAGRANDLRRPTPIGTRLLVHFAETGGGGLVAPVLKLWGSCTEANNPMSAVDSVLLATLTIPIGGVLITDSVNGFPFLQAEILNGDGDAGMTVCGAFRVYPS